MAGVTSAASRTNTHCRNTPVFGEDAVSGDAEVGGGLA
jgi:hypothetical protein